MVALKVFEVGVASLTAVMTFIAGMPRIDCICPNGDVKHFCLGSAAGSACCCAGSCCGRFVDTSGAPNVQTPKRSCCCHTADGSTDKGQQEKAGQNPCHRQLADTTTASIATISSGTLSSDASNVLYLIALPLSYRDIAPFAAPDRLGSPPTPLLPTDLLATCKRLLI